MLFEKQNVKYDYIFNWSGFSRLGDIICNDLYEYNKNYVWLHDEMVINEFYNKCDKFLNRYNFIFCVSNELSNKVKKVYESVSDKVVLLYNPVDVENILALSKGDGFKDDYKECRILSVGRLYYVKGFDIAIKACKLLISKGYKIKWYIIGEGEERNNLTSLIRENNMENNIVLLGENYNPYPFLKSVIFMFRVQGLKGIV